MAVITQYVVEHPAYSNQGKQAMIFTSKKEADAYDKAFDIAESVQSFLQGSECKINEKELEALSLFIAQHRDEVGLLLKGKKATEEKALNEKTSEDKPSKDSEIIKKQTEKNIKAIA